MKLYTDSKTADFGHSMMQHQICHAHALQKSAGSVLNLKKHHRMAFGQSMRQQIEGEAQA